MTSACFRDPTRVIIATALLCLVAIAPLRADDEEPKGEAPDAEAKAIVWQTDVDGALARAKDEGKPALVYLRADYCLFCKQMEERVWTDPRVIEAAGELVTIKVDLTRLTPRVAEVQNRVKAPGRTPWVAFFDSKGKLLDSKRLGYEDEEIGPEELAKILKKVSSS